MKQRILAASLAVLLLTGCGTSQPLDTEPTADGVPLTYIPLDDRPDNVERAVYLAESLGYALQMPEEDWYRTRLDGQPLNGNGTQSGDRAALYNWVMEQELAGCDRYVLSLDQLLSGGLVNARAMSQPEPVVFQDGAAVTEQSELEVLGNLLTTLAADEHNQVWLLDSVMRLAPTVGYEGGTLEDYNALRAYGAEPRPELSGDALTLGGVEETYPLGADGSPLSWADYGLTNSQMSDYLSARSRKLELSDDLLETVTGMQAENLHVLIGIDDSSEENSIQKNEIAYLRSLLRPGDALLSGVDDLAFKAITRLYQQENGWTGATVSVRYYGGTEEQPACAYDYQPLTTVMAEHLEFFQLTEGDDAALQVLVLTQPADEAQKEAYMNALLKDLQDCQKAEHPVILIDAGNGRYGGAFQRLLTEQASLGWLLSYAGFLDMAIVTGTALSHGAARYAFLQSGTQTEVTERAFARTLADSVLKDFCYKNDVRDKLLSYVRNDLGGSADNFWQPEIDRTAVLTYLETEMKASTASVLENLTHSNFISSLTPYTLRGWGSVALDDYRFPWDRAFEIGMEIRLGTFTAPHRQMAGVWVS